MTNPDAQRPNLNKAPPQTGLPPHPYGPSYPGANQYPPNPYGPPADYDAYQPPLNYPAPQPGYNAYGPNPYGYAPMPPGPQSNGIALAAMITGIVSALLLLMSFMFLFVSVPFSFVGGIAAIILGFIGMGQTKRTGQNGYGMAVAGVLTGAVNLLLTVVIVLIIVAVVASNN